MAVIDIAAITCAAAFGLYTYIHIYIHKYIYTQTVTFPFHSLECMNHLMDVDLLMNAQLLSHALHTTDLGSCDGLWSCDYPTWLMHTEGHYAH